MANPFVHVELNTRDLATSKKFYAHRRGLRALAGHDGEMNFGGRDSRFAS